mgnify:CR=1 FL=1
MRDETIKAPKEKLTIVKAEDEIAYWKRIAEELGKTTKRRLFYYMFYVKTNHHQIQRSLLPVVLVALLLPLVLLPLFLFFVFLHHPSSLFVYR